MAGEMQPMPMSPRQSPKEIGNAVVQWACTRRGRTLVLAFVACVVLLGVGGIHNREAISSQYHALATNNSWRPYLPSIPSLIHSPFRKPSNTTLQLENGELAVVPQQLKKTTPNFHLVMPAREDSPGFCKTTMSGMILNYPPPTVVNLYSDYNNDIHWEREILQGTLHYLKNDKFVKDDDLVLIVDGENTWFQLPSDAIIKEYTRVLGDANALLLGRHGKDKDGQPKFSQTIVFGAEKMCEADDLACHYAPNSILPGNLYANGKSAAIADRPARYLNSKMLMGPANDLKVLYQAALKKFDKKQTQRQTIQSVFATMFGEQQLRRDADEKNNKPMISKIKDMVSGKKPNLARKMQTANVTASNPTRHEFSIGVDYEHALFQPLAYARKDELVSVLHDNSTDLSKYRQPNSWIQYLALPSSLSLSNPPFWRLDLAKSNPSPNEKPAYIDKLAFNDQLDKLPKRKTPWNNVPLLQNTYTGSVPTILFQDPNAAVRANSHLTALQHGDPAKAPAANVTWDAMWYSPFKRALLRNYFRTPQSPQGYHNSLVGGDRAWDTRGGRGGVWTATENVWLPWGEVDGVCGTLTRLKEVFHDSKGVWLHEGENNSEETRLHDEDELNKKIEKQRQKAEEDAKTPEQKEKERKEKAEQERKQKAEEEKKKKEEEEKKKKEDEEKKKKEEEETKKKEEDTKKKEEEEKKKKEEETKKKAEEDKKAEEEKKKKAEEEKKQEKEAQQKIEDAEREQQRKAAEEMLREVEMGLSGARV
ncbi:hypothetical protein CC86DRAFT_464004 [Ophiobolus disseminans]|uniref:Uncharacterized protein n=1 Tax=Ophiobolus disseminans TaxID=1469910 RepID=A0A6A7AD17_9PLEO|nr:hypothetical protein CC86DRAFT_464004 [Ophiobolus disseminans]